MSVTTLTSLADVALPAATTLTDEQIVNQVLRGETALFETIMRRYNRRLYRLVRAILKNDIEAEDAVQEAYLKAYAHLAQFAGRASFRTWLMKIAINEARRRLMKHTGPSSLEDQSEAASGHGPSVEHEAAVHEMADVLERMIDELPEPMRTVFVMREIEQLNPAETAEALGILEITVRTRLHRARRYLRKLAYAHFGDAASQVFEFGAERCDHIVEKVMRVVERRQPQTGYRHMEAYNGKQG